MNFVSDESVDRQIVERLRDDGHFVWYVAEMAPSISDDEVLKIAQILGLLGGIPRISQVLQTEYTVTLSSNKAAFV